MSIKKIHNQNSFENNTNMESILQNRKTIKQLKSLTLFRKGTKREFLKTESKKNKCVQRKLCCRFFFGFEM